MQEPRGFIRKISIERKKLEIPLLELNAGFSGLASSLCRAPKSRDSRIFIGVFLPVIILHYYSPVCFFIFTNYFSLMCFHLTWFYFC